MSRHLWAVGLIAAAVFCGYAGTLSNGFLGDDRLYVEANPFVQNPANLKHLADPRFYLGGHEVLAGSRPVFLASLMFDRAYWGPRPGGFHATNMTLHAANGALLYALGSALGLPFPIALGAAGAFVLHPIQTEAVCSVGFRTDLLAAFFTFLSLLAFISARRYQGRRRAAALAVSTLSFALGLLAKESAAVLPLFALLAEIYFPQPRGRKARLLAALCLYALTAVAFLAFWAPRFRYEAAGAPTALRRVVNRAASVLPTAGQGTFNLAVPKARVFAPSSWEWKPLFADPSKRGPTQVRALADDIKLLVYPRDLTADRAPVVVQGWNGPWVPSALILLAGTALAAVFLRRRAPLAGFSCAWLLVSFIPFLNVLPLYNPVAERYLYQAAAAAAWLAATALYALSRAGVARAPLAAAGLGALLLGAYGARVQARVKDWRDEKSLYLAAPSTAPQNAAASLIRGDLLRDENRFAEAAKQYETALRLNPLSAEAMLGAAKAQAGLGDVPAADRWYEKALAAAPAHPALRFDYGVHLARTGRADLALKAYRAAVDLEPGFLEAWVNRAALLRNLRRFREARACYEKALPLAGPHDPIPEYSYATLLEKEGKTAQAAEHFLAATERDPSFRPARLRLARAYARLGRRAEMLEQIRAAGAILETEPR